MNSAPDGPRPELARELARDPVCGMSVDPSTAEHHVQHEGVRYFFCAANCRQRFLANPKTFLDPAGPSPAEAAANALGEFTCPMHPEVLQLGPGACPYCGMALEPVLISAESGPNPELSEMTRRLWLALALTVPIVLLDMGGHFFPAVHRVLSPNLSTWIQAALATPVVLWAGWPFFARAWVSVRTRQLNMFTLIAIGTGMAWLYSLIATLAPGAFPAAFRGMGGTVEVYFEPAAVITVLVLVGQVLELRAREQTSGAVKALLRLTPAIAHRINAVGGGSSGAGGSGRSGAESEQDVPLESVQLGDRLRIRPGEKVPVDGVVEQGESALDESLLTGESMPVRKSVGELVIGGSLNQTGSLVIRAERIGRDTMLAQIVQLVAQAQRSRAPIQRVADRVAGWFVPVVLLIAVLAFVVWASFGPEPQLAYALIAAVSVLIIACPCALGLATPMSIMVGVGRGASSGILIRDAEALEVLAKVDTVVLDKTGTLTQGHPALAQTVPTAELAADDLLRLAAGVEQSSEHPLGRALVTAALEAGLAIAAVTEFESTTGGGALGRVEGRRVLLGNADFLGRYGLNPAALSKQADELRDEGGTAIFIGVDEVLAGIFAIKDPVKDSAPAALAALRADGIQIVLLSGDNPVTAAAVGRRLGIDRVEGNALPADKGRIIAQLRDQGRIVAMVGDGVNDAPALAAAHVGLAMSSGTDIAMESAGITLLGGDLMGIQRARKLSAATMRNIRQNLGFAFVYNAAGIPLAAGLLYPTLGWRLSPIIAAAAMALSSVSVIGNALRLRTQPLS